MAFNKKFLLATTFIAGLAMAAPSLAQQQPSNQDEDEEGEQVEDVVVTGSRLRRDEFSSSSPVQVITGEQAALEGMVDTAELLQQSTIASGSYQLNNQLTGFVTEGGGSINSVSLRGLGAQRTLVLLNGRRVGPAGTRGQVQAVDLNVIPQSMIERIEILKDGASSVYGSDAIAGVVNIITRTNLDGFEASAFINRSFDGGGDVQRYNLGWGSTFDRGYIQAGFDYYRQDELTRADREDTACAADYLFDPTTGARVDILDQVSGTAQCYNLFASALRANPGPGTMDLIYMRPGYNYAVAGNNSNVVGMARQARGYYPGTYSYYNGQSPLYDRASVVSPVERYTVTAMGGFDLTPNVEVYGEFMYNRRQSEQNGVRQFFPTVYTGYIGAQRPDTGTNFLGSTLLPIIPKTSDNDQSIDYYRGVVGIRGTFGNAGFLSGWDWDLYGQWARSDGDYSTESIYADRVAAVTGVNVGVTAITGPGPCYTGPLVTNVSGYSCASLPGGVPWTSQRVLTGNFNQAERDFLFFTQEGNTTYDHRYVEGSMAGDLFELPAGAVGAAVGFQFRQEEIDDTPDPMAQAGNLWGQTAAGRTTGSDTVREVFGEIEVPIIRGFTGIDELTVNLSGRYSDYDSYGQSDTYKVGLNWQITPAWRVRLSQGTSFRAPALYELYLANQTSFLGQTAVDPCIDWGNSTNPRIQANCAAAGVPFNYTGLGSSALIITGGGLGVLEPETAEARTLGVIWTPAFIDMSVAVDYFEIDVDNEVRTFGAGNILYQCYNATDYPTNPFCSLFTRAGPADPTRPNQIITVNNSYVNVAAQTNRGIDLTVRYNHEFSFGDLSLDGQFTWQLEDRTTLLGTATPEDTNGETTEPDFTGQFNIRFDRGDWTAFWAVDMIGKASDTEEVGADVFLSSRYSSVVGVPTPVYYKQYTEFTAYHDFSLRYRMDDWTFQAGVQNVFDERPPAQSAGQFRVGTAALNLYDMVGRRGFISVSRRF
ncbi:MAG TPA: TonB-dependent receptor [Brevundimonas sp.]|uniref:TonB-dependent receptor plug domain-containing protein n=1 Tax=Brevundimonas sp. TaxID=1871086 RepID=UPI002B67936B|nr:TonB-dependent receptor [Brevundimonas sp.]HRH19301.1 TonB-dependent receptor [Brevundimonas sp.]